MYLFIGVSQLLVVTCYILFCLSAKQKFFSTCKLQFRVMFLLICLPSSTRTICGCSRRSPNLREGRGPGTEMDTKGAEGKGKWKMTRYHASTSIISRVSNEMAYLVGRWCGCGHVVVRCCPVRLRTCQTDPWSCDWASTAASHSVWTISPQSWSIPSLLHWARRLDTVYRQVRNVWRPVCPPGTRNVVGWLTYEPDRFQDLRRVLNVSRNTRYITLHLDFKVS